MREMGQISGEELIKLEKMHALAAREEKILVLVRLRPLSEKEVTTNEVADWECINDTTILYRNSLREGSLFPSAYTFDKVFHGDCSTKQVYEEGTKQIALSVVSGINSSIFAYGQTSSGKTYTMDGVTERTMADIFDYVHKHEERAFVLKFSAIEIYNEAIRDLLTTDNTSLRLRDDPEKGTTVEKVTEETLRDWNHFNELVSFCEAQRQIGETSLNERSSRSHQILKLTVESSAREFIGKGNSTTLAASVNFIDLAGSERASQSLSAGTRLKEGCHINRSLLTLGTVIRKLSKGRHGHINYRDSKLTRILQPALGGNARTAIICTLSPARSHVEQTRNTLLFACCAKQVTTKAQVNVVMSDKALVKHLQKEVARLESELKTPAPVVPSSDYAAIIRRKDQQIQKLEKEVKELTIQKDLAQSRVGDLLQMLEDERDSRQPTTNGHGSNWKAEDTWGDGSDSESSLVTDSYGFNAGMRKFNGSNNNGNGHLLWENREDDCDADGGDPDEYCKDVRCIETGGESTFEAPGSSITELEQPVISQSFDEEVTSENMIRENGNAEGSRGRNVSPQSSIGDNTPSPSGFRVRKGKSCRTKFFKGSATSCVEEAEDVNTTPPNEFEKNFPGRPEGHGTKFLPLNYSDGVPRLSRNGSQSSMDTASVAPSMSVAADEEITTVQTFVAGMKEMADAYEKQLADKDVKNIGDAAFDPVQLALADPSIWHVEFERKQRVIVELWQACNVPLVHRTYFFLLFRGDPMDSIYMEVELRRLTFMKELIADGGEAIGADGRTVTLNSSMKHLHRERSKLSKMMSRRLSDEEREKLFTKWGIDLESKRRRLQLARLLWSQTENLNHITDSAAVIAKLVRFPAQASPLKGMLGFSFGTSSTRRRSFGWINKHGFNAPL